MLNSLSYNPRRKAIWTVAVLVFLLLVGGFYVAYKKGLLGFLAETKPKTMTEEEMDRLALADGAIRLRANEAAIVKRVIGENKSDKKIVHTLSFKDGSTEDIEVDKETQVQVLEGSDEKYVAVKPGPEVTIRYLNVPPSEIKDKVEIDVSKKLEKGDKVKVIIKYANIGPVYNKNQSKEQFSIKNNNFEKAKNSVAEQIRGKGNIKRDLKIIGASSAEIDQDALKILRKSPEVEKVVLDKTYRIFLDQSVDYINANDVWNIMDSSNEPITGRGKTIAVIDTGVDYTHADLGGCFGPDCKVIGGYDFVGNDANPMDDQGHGTHVAATAAGRGLLYGVAPEAKILAYKVCNSGGSCSGSAIIAAIEMASDPDGNGDTSDHADVISMSIGGGGNPDDEMSQAVDISSGLDVVNVIAAGNSGPSPDSITSPGVARTAITVAAACKPSDVGVNPYCSQNIADFSSRGPLIWNGENINKPDVSAPGVMICAARWGAAFATAPTCFDSQHVRISGTSMATPHVSGAVALIRQAYPNYTPDQVKGLLKATATDLGMPYDAQGAGLINLTGAIPFAPKLQITPPLWAFNADPRVKITTKEQIFSVTSLDSEISTLDITTESVPAGMTINFNKTQLNVGGGATDTFTATVTADNDLLDLGSHYINIYLSKNNVKKGMILAQAQIVPQITISPADEIDFGNDNPDLSSWTSETKQITVTNLRTDIAQTATIQTDTLPNGITLDASPPSISIPAGQTANFNLRLTVNNSLVANGRYSSTVTVGTSKTRVYIDVSFDKNYFVIIEDLSRAPYDLIDIKVLNPDRGYNIVYDYQDNRYYVHFLEKISYQILVSYWYMGHWYHVFKEDVFLNTTGKVVQVDRNEAVHKITTNFVDENGGDIIGNTHSYTDGFVYLPNKNYFTSALHFAPYGLSEYHKSIYISSISSDIGYVKSVIETQPRERIHDLYFEVRGPINGHKTITNNQYNLIKFKLAQNYPPGDTGKPWIQRCSSGGQSCGGASFLNLYITLPEMLYLYTQRTGESFGRTDSYVAFLDYDRVGCPATGACDKLAQSSALDYNLTSRLSDAMITDDSKFKRFLMPLQSDTMYVGLGPVFWGGQFQNQNGLIGLKPYFGDLFPEMFLRQDYAWQEYNEVSYEISQNGSPVATGTLPKATLPSFTSGTISPISVSTDGVYEFSIPSFPYLIQRQAMNASVYSKFDTAAQDKNPPAIRRLYFLTNNLRSEVYDENGNNRLEFEFDPLGGEMKEYRAFYSTNGTDFNAVPVSFVGGSGVTALLPAIPGSGKITLKIEGEDQAANLTSFTFELPRSPAPSGPAEDTAAPAVRIVTPYPITNPYKALQAGINKVDVQVHDDFAVTKVELYANGELKETKTTGPFIFDWDTSSFTTLGVSDMKLEVKAYDAANNVSTSEPINVLIQQQDRIPPVVNFINPKEGQNIYGTINITAEIYDLHSPVYLVQVSAIRWLGVMEDKGNNIWEMSNVDTTEFPDGIREITIQAADSPTGQPSGNVTRKMVNVFVANHSPRTSITADKNTVARGEEITYTITLENPASYTATNVRIENAIPVGTTYIEGSASSGGVYDGNAKKIVWSWPSFDPDQNANLTFRVRVD